MLLRALRLNKKVINEIRLVDGLIGESFMLRTWKKVCAGEGRDEEEVVQDAGHPIWDECQSDNKGI